MRPDVAEQDLNDSGGMTAPSCGDSRFECGPTGKSYARSLSVRSEELAVQHHIDRKPRLERPPGTRNALDWSLIEILTGALVTLRIPVSNPRGAASNIPRR